MMRPAAPRVMSVSMAEAYEAARRESEPVFVPTNVYCDDRGWSIMNQMQGVLSSDGQVNYSVQYPGVIKAWHRHKHQTDFWLCLHGHIKVGVHRSEDGTSWSIVCGEKRAGVLIIPPTLWHGAATVGPTPAGLLYYVTKSFNPADPDEERMSHDAVPDFPWQVEHR